MSVNVRVTVVVVFLLPVVPMAAVVLVRRPSVTMSSVSSVMTRLLFLLRVMMMPVVRRVRLVLVSAVALVMHRHVALVLFLVFFVVSVSVMRVAMMPVAVLCGNRHSRHAQ
jgi:hypothetical protein